MRMRGGLVRWWAGREAGRGWRGRLGRVEGDKSKRCLSSWAANSDWCAAFEEPLPSPPSCSGAHTAPPFHKLLMLPSSRFHNDSMVNYEGGKGRIEVQRHTSGWGSTLLVNFDTC